jgi:uncharacterized protein (TIGR03437 family)
MRFLRIVGGVLLCAGFAVGQSPSVTAVVNAASWILGTITTPTTEIAGLPNSGIAQGSIFTIEGTGLGPANIVFAPSAFQTMTLSGTSVSITPVNNQIVNVPLYYTSATQVSALMPSNMPLGAATLTVTYNGAISINDQPITVVQNNLGIFTESSNGQGVGIVTFPDYSLVSTSKAANCGGPYTNCGAANPGDTLILWATGLGPVSGNELGGAGLGMNMGNIALTLWLGGVQAKVTYQGRSSCCIGEDQINFVVPNNVPTGCAVPLMVQIGTNSQITANFVMISNSTVIPVASGSRTCTPSNPIYSPSVVQQLTSGAPFSFGLISLARNLSSATETGNGVIYEDDGLAEFGAYTVAASFQDFVLPYLDSPPLGTCLVSNPFTPVGAPPQVTATGLDAGAVGVSSPTTSPAPMLETQNTGQITLYTAPNLGATNPGTYLSQRGAFTVTGAGGKDIGKFITSITVGAIPGWTNEGANVVDGAYTVTRENGVTLTWPTGPTSGVSSLAYILIAGVSYTDANFQNAAAFSCVAPAGAGTFTVPPPVLAALPPGPYFELEFQPYLTPIAFTASGLDLGSFSINYLTASFGTLQ